MTTDTHLATWSELTNAEQAEALFRGFPTDAVIEVRKRYADNELALVRWIKGTPVRDAVGIIRSVAVGVAALTAAACVQAPQGSTYAAIVVTQSGNEYRAAHALTLSECRARIADMPSTDVYCERER